MPHGEKGGAGEEGERGEREARGQESFRERAALAKGYVFSRSLPEHG